MKATTLVIDAAFVMMVVMFFKTQLGLTGWKTMLAALITCAVIAAAPLVGAMFPVLSPWLEMLVNIVVLFLGAAGTYDFVMAVHIKKLSG